MTTPKSFIVIGNYHTQEYVELSVDRASYVTPVQISIHPDVPKDANDRRGLTAFLSPAQVDELIDELERIREMLREPDEVEAS